jgi:hypothetical protein
MAEAGPRETILGTGAGGPLTAPTPWIQNVGFIYYPAGGIIIGPPSIAGGNKGVGTINAAHYYINGVEIIPGNYLLLTGGTLTGLLTLSGDPTTAFHAATKNYVDNRITTVNGTFANYLPLTGGTLTGSLTFTGASTDVTLAHDPASALQAATKQYVDNLTQNIIAIPDAPSDGTTYARNNGAWTNTMDAGTF